MDNDLLTVRLETLNLAHALQSTRQVLEHLAFGSLTGRMTDVNDGALSLKTTIGEAAMMENLTPAERREFESIDRQASRLVEECESFRVEFGKIVAAHDNLLAAIDGAVPKAEALCQSTRDLEDTMDRTEELAGAPCVH